MDESGKAEKVWFWNGIEKEIGFEKAKVVGVKGEDFCGEKSIVGVGFEEKSVELASE